MKPELFDNSIDILKFIAKKRIEIKYFPFCSHKVWTNLNYKNSAIHSNCFYDLILDIFFKVEYI